MLFLMSYRWTSRRFVWYLHQQGSPRAPSGVAWRDQRV